MRPLRTLPAAVTAAVLLTALPAVAAVSAPPRPASPQPTSRQPTSSQAASTGAALAAGTTVVEHDRAGRVVTRTTGDKFRFSLARPVHRRITKADTVTLTLRYLDRSGRPAIDASAGYANLDGSDIGEAENRDGVSVLHLPKGRYLLGAQVQTGQQRSALLQPLLNLTGNTTVTLDARLAKPLQITVADQSVRPCLAVLYAGRRMDDGSFLDASFGTGALDGLTAAQLGPNVPASELTSTVVTQWAVPGKAGDFSDSPVTYNTSNVVRGKFFTGYQRLVRPAELARFVSRLHSTSPHLLGMRTVTNFAPDVMWAAAKMLFYRQPRTVIEYVEPGTEVVARYDEGQLDADGGFTPITESGWESSRSFAAGRSYGLTWNKAVLGPDLQEGTAERTGDLVNTRLALFADQAGNRAYGAFDPAASTKLFQNGNLVAESDVPGELQDAQVVPGQGMLRLESHVDRSPLTARSTSIDAAWTFASETVTGPLPLWAVRFQPAVDLTNTVARTPVSTIPFTVKPMPGAKVGALKQPVIELSGDGGKTWRRASVVPKGHGRYVAVAATPGGAKTISLRARAADSAGNKVEETIVAAYGLR